MEKMRVAIYVRVSNEEQDAVNQFNQLQPFAAGLGELVRTYNDTATGKNGDRKEFKRMLADAGRRRFDCLIFWALDRLTREGPLKTLLYLEQLSACGVKALVFRAMVGYNHAHGRVVDSDLRLDCTARAPADQ